MSEEQINLFLNDFMNYNKAKNNLMFDNLDIFLELFYFLQQIKSISYQEEYMPNFDKITKMDFLQKIKLISNFYKSMNIDVDINEIVNSGVLGIKTPNMKNIDEEEMYHYLFFGTNHYIENFKSISVYNNGIVTDSIIWVHEISHYRNQPKHERSQVNALLTESLAFTEQFIYMDYLKNSGYEYEADSFKYVEYINFYSHAIKTYNLLKIYILYDKLGKVSKENYKLLYKTEENYDYFIEEFSKKIRNNPNEIISSLKYLLASLLSIYMYISYKNNPKFIENIKLLNDNLNELSLKECLQIIGFNTNDNYLCEENLNKIKEAFQQYEQELKEYIQKKEL